MSIKKYRKKLIEVELPITILNAEARHEKGLTKKGHPFLLHRYWSRKPNSTCRCLIFASLIDDPSSWPEYFPTKKEQDKERSRLIKILCKISNWENSFEKSIWDSAKKEVAICLARNKGEYCEYKNTFETDPKFVEKYLAEHGPPIYDPFSGGGSIPLEAKRLGLSSYASDINPLALLLNKGLLEVPTSLASLPSIHPSQNKFLEPSANNLNFLGLATDIRHYGKIIYKRIVKKLEGLYPNITLSDGTKLKIYAWLWCRTITCQNPDCSFQVPLIKQYKLSRRSYKSTWLIPILNKETNKITWTIEDYREGEPAVAKKIISRKGVTCLACDEKMKLAYVREQGKKGKFQNELLAIVAEGQVGKSYFAATDEQLQVSKIKSELLASLKNKHLIPENAIGVNLGIYGYKYWEDLFTDRQLLLIQTIKETLEEIREEYDLLTDNTDYKDFLYLYLVLCFGKMVETNSNFCSWRSNRETVVTIFIGLILPMIWNFAENNPLSDKGQTWLAQVEQVASTVLKLPTSESSHSVFFADAATTEISKPSLIITDPPYYDLTGYLDLSNFFEIWLQELVGKRYPDFFGHDARELREKEIVVNRQDTSDTGSKFDDLLNKAFLQINKNQHPDYPCVIFYAYKNQQGDKTKVTKAWQPILKALADANLEISQVYCLVTEKRGRIVAKETTNLLSSIVLVCRARSDNPKTFSTKPKFLNELRNQLFVSLDLFIDIDNNIGIADTTQFAVSQVAKLYSQYSGVPITFLQEIFEYSVEAVFAYYKDKCKNLDLLSCFCLEWLERYGFSFYSMDEVSNLCNKFNLKIVDLPGTIFEKSNNFIKLKQPNFLSGEINKDSISIWELCLRLVIANSKDNFRLCSKLINLEQYNEQQISYLATYLYKYYERNNAAKEGTIFNRLLLNKQKLEEFKSLSYQMEFDVSV